VSRLSVLTQLFSFSLLALAISPNAHASAYIEAGTGLGSFVNGESFFGQSTASKGNGFLGSLSFYVPVTSEKRFAHLQLGLQNRVLQASDSAGNPLYFGSSEIGARLEISRLFVGAGYAPLTYVNKPGSGITSLYPNHGSTAYFFEVGAIWRVIPELQICAAYSLEKGLQSGGSSPSPISEYGLRFRFPLDPTDHKSGSKGVDFDGFRYPFGFMK
jgi:hypothetical protein